jgi:uncharacterized protein
MTMLYRRFGRTELSMPVFSCGGMRYQYKWQDMSIDQIPDQSQQNLEATILRSLELGINHIETARGYGTSEVQLGQILPKLPREKLIVQTKIAPSSNPWKFRQTFNQSLSNLGLDYVDLLGIHGINTPEILQSTLKPWGCLRVARQLQAQGKVRFIGFSTHGPTETIVDAINTGEFDYVNLHWYYINQINWPAIEAATQQDMGVFIISPTNKGGMLNQPSPKLVKLCAPLSPIVFNDLFCLSHPQVHTISLGAARPEDFDEHLKTLNLLNQAQHLLPPIQDQLEQAAVAALGKHWWETWRVGLPTPQQTPGGINIPVILWLWNLAQAYDMIEYGKMRYNLLGNGGHWFPGAKLETIEAQKLRDCLNHSPHIEQILTILSQVHALLGGQPVKRLSQS